MVAVMDGVRCSTGGRTVSPNGKTLAFAQRTPLGNYDTLTLSLDAPGEPSVLLGSRFDEIQLRFSPDRYCAHGTFQVQWETCLS
jgi:hypothetical protein